MLKSTGIYCYGIQTRPETRAKGKLQKGNFTPDTFRPIAYLLTPWSTVLLEKLTGL
jgi:hypothetical protein